MFNLLNRNHTYNTTVATYNLLDIPQVWTLLDLKHQKHGMSFKGIGIWILNCDTSDFIKSQTFFANYNDV